jgi:hypothetical protein
MAATNLANPIKQPRRKKFRFAPETSQVIGTVLGRDDFTDEEKSNYWWSREKSHTFRSAACNIIETARANTDEDNMIYLIDDSYKFAKDVACCLEDDAIEEILRDPSLHTRRLEVWSTNGHNFCGLERMISQLQQLERRAGCVRLRRDVVNMSKTTRTVEEISEIATRLSLTGRVYARMVGHAEAHIIYYAQRNVVRGHAMVFPPEPKAPRTPRTQKHLPPLKQSSWRRLMRFGKAIPTV